MLFGDKIELKDLLNIHHVLMCLHMLPWDDSTDLSVLHSNGRLDDDLYAAFLDECGKDVVDNVSEIDAAVSNLLALLDKRFMLLRNEDTYKDIYAKYEMQQKGRLEERRKQAEMERQKADAKYKEQVAIANKWLDAHIYKFLLKDRNMMGRVIADAISKEFIPDYVKAVYPRIVPQTVYSEWNIVKNEMASSADGHVTKYDDMLDDSVIDEVAESMDDFVVDDMSDDIVDDAIPDDEVPVYDDISEYDVNDCLPKSNEFTREFDEPKIVGFAFQK